MIVYLSGPIENARNSGADWRKMMTEWLKLNLDHGVFDPVLETKTITNEYGEGNFRELKKSRPAEYKKLFRKIIKKDLKAVIEKADYLIVLWDKSVFKGGGTHGEVTMAYWFGKPIFLVNRLPLDDLSSWISSCATQTFNSFDELKEGLYNTYH